jgi:hypothetical protein
LSPQSCFALAIESFGCDGNEQRFSPLHQISKANVGQLPMASARGLLAGTEVSTPIFYRGVMDLYAP